MQNTSVKMNRAIPLDGPICLNLGGRLTKIPGFIVVDRNKDENTDIEGDVSDLSMFSDGAVSQIYASHILEHFPHNKTVDVLKEWCRVLKKGGEAFISVPDFDVLVKYYKRIGLTQWIVDLGWGGQEYPEAYHYSPFNFHRLALVLTKAGFSNMERIAHMPFGLADCSELRNTVDGTMISLNMRAIK